MGQSVNDRWHDSIPHRAQISWRGNLLDGAKSVTTVLPTPTVQRNENNVIYMTATSKLVIQGTNFVEKGVSSLTRLWNVTRTTFIGQERDHDGTNAHVRSLWRSEPGPLRLRRINTGAGALRIDPKYGGIVIAEVQANLGAHGVTVNLHRTNASIRTQAS